MLVRGEVRSVTRDLLVLNRSFFLPLSQLTSAKLVVLRTDLANERTFLAWIRTAASLTTLGFAIDKLSADNEHVFSAVCFITLGILSTAFGTVRYYRVKLAMSLMGQDADLGIGRLGMKW